MRRINLRSLSGVLLAAAAGLAGCKAKSTYVHVQILPGPQGEPATLTQVELDLSLGGKNTTLTLGDAATPITLPTDVTLEVKSGSGQLAITVIARNAAGAEVDRGVTTAQVSSGAIAEATVQLPGGKADIQPAEGSRDFGAIATGTVSVGANVSFVNNGFRPSGPLSVALGGVGTSAFVLGTNGCAGVVLAPSASCAVAVQFRPTAVGTFAATLTITGTPGGAPAVSLTGIGSTNPQTLTVTLAGNGRGTVAGNPAGISCTTGSCSHPFEWGTPVTLTPTPATGSHFASWTGGGCTGTGACTVTTDAAKTVTASFALDTETLTLSVAGDGNVTSPSDASVHCGSAVGATACTGSYNYGTTVTLLASPGSGSHLSSWGDPGCPATSSSCTLTMTSSKTPTVAFALNVNALYIHYFGNTGTGTVASGESTPVVNCTATSVANSTTTPCAAGSYPYGTVFTLTATAASDSAFIGWAASGASCTTVGGNPATCQITMPDAQVDVTAQFDHKPVPVTFTFSGNGSGSVSDGVATPCPSSSAGTCTFFETYGSTPTFTLFPDTGSAPSGPSPNWCTPSVNSCTQTLPLTAPESAVIGFTLNQYLLTVGANTGTGTGNVTSLDGLFNCGTGAGSCSQIYNYGDSVTLVPAATSSSSTFAGWSGACTNTTGNCVVTIHGALTATPTFNLIGETLNVATNGGTGSGTYSCQVGSGSAGTCATQYPYNTSVTIIPSAATGSSFVSWAGCDSTSGNNCIVAMTKTQSVTATFNLVQETLNVSTSGGNGSGTVQCKVGSVTASCATTYPYGTSVTVIPTPAANSTFASWAGCTSTSGNNCIISMTGTESVTATFNLITLTVATSGAGGTVSSGTTFNCTNNTGSCGPVTFTSGTNVSLTAAPSTGSSFAGWSGAAGCSTTSPCSVTMTTAITVTATFNYNFTSATSGTGSGSVQCKVGSGASGPCLTNYPSGTALTVLAVPSPTSVFTGWTGGLPSCGAANPCSLTMNQAQSVTAAFASNTLTVTSPGALGTIKSTDLSINCGNGSTVCSATYNTGTSIQLTATAVSGTTFVGWAAGCTGTTNPCSLTLNAPTAVTGNFNYNLGVTLAGNGSGSVQCKVSGPGNTFGPCAANYPSGTSLTLQATALTGSSFTGWSGGCTGTTNPCALTMSQTQSVTAAFALQPESLTLNLAGGNGTGTVACAVNNNPATNCATSYLYGDSVVITATASTGSQFAGWAVDCSNTTGTCDLSMTTARNVTAIFNLISETLTVFRSGTATGSVADNQSPSVLSCPTGNTTCSANYNYNTRVTLTATAGPNANFIGWSGACTGASTCTVTMTQAQNVTATFNLIPETLSVFKAGSSLSGATFSYSPPGATCGPGCTSSGSTLDYGTVVTLTASVAAGTLFQGWSGDCSGNQRTCTVTMTATKSVTANFVKQSYNLVFVSSVLYPPTFGSARAYDARCNQLANAAGLSNPTSTAFSAWMSDNGSNAVTQVQNARGFTRIDGLPFSDLVTDITTKDRIMNPIDLDENGAAVGAEQVWTGSTSAGVNASGLNCQNWTNLNASHQNGWTLGGPTAWSSYTSSSSCNFNARIYCFEQDKNVVLSTPLATGKLIFAAVGFTPNPSTTPDTHCNNNKPSGSTSIFRAMVSTTSSPASAVLSPIATYVNKDGQAIGTGAQIVAGGLKTGMWVNSSGGYLAGFPNAWAGSTSPDVVGNSTSTCNDWTTPTGSGNVGLVSTLDSFWQWGIYNCQFSNALYCVEQ